MSEFQAGSLRYRVDIQVPVDGKDSAGGPLVDQWTTLYANVPCAIDDLNGREYFTARQVQSNVSTEITIRTRPKMTSRCRLIKYVDPNDCGSPPEVVIYNIESVLSLGTMYLKLMCSIRDADGFRADG